jgi:hypothetical protein
MRYERSLKSKLKKGTHDNQTEPIQRLSKSSRAYRMFLEGKTTTQVAIELNLPFEEARKYWTEFVRLQGMQELYYIYVDNEYHIDLLRKIYYFLLRNKVEYKDFEAVLHVAYDITNLNQTRSYLEGEVERLKKQKNYWLNYDKIQHPAIRPIPPMRPMPFIRRNIYY